MFKLLYGDGCHFKIAFLRCIKQTAHWHIFAFKKCLIIFQLYLSLCDQSLKAVVALTYKSHPQILLSQKHIIERQLEEKKSYILEIKKKVSRRNVNKSKLNNLEKLTTMGR